MKTTCPVWASAVAAALCLSCGEYLGLANLLPDSCSDGGGTKHAGRIDGRERWQALDGPHRVTNVQVNGELVINAGALVCFAQDARLDVLPKATLTARGGADSPIVFTASSTAARWAGIRVNEEANATLVHVRLEHANTGIEVESAGKLELERSVIRQIEGPAIKSKWAAYTSLVETAIDSVCSSSCTAAIVASGYLEFRDSHILASGAIGLYGDPYSEVLIDGGSIEGSKGIGLVKSNYPAGSRTLGRRITAMRPIRITGGGSYPARIPLQFAPSLLPSRDAQDGWRGNARDTVVWLSEWGGVADHITIYPGLAWSSSTGSHGVTVRRLELQPGAEWTVSGILNVEKLLSQGTAEAPVEILAPGSWSDWLNLGAASPEASSISHTHLVRTRLLASANHTVLMDQVVSDTSHIRLGFGSRVSRSAFRGDLFVHPGRLAVIIAATDVQLSNCEVSRIAGTGIRIDVATGVSINDCNLHENTGVAIDNRAAQAVDARNNWWGDPAGPNGPNGNRFSGNVLFEPYRTQPIQTNVQPRPSRPVH